MAIVTARVFVAVARLGAPIAAYANQFSHIADDIATACTLFQEYANDIRVDLCFQGFADELAGLPRSYGPPRGRLLIAWEGETPAGCVALRPMNATICEMKRLFVRPAFRGRGIGKDLVNAIIHEAEAIGYTTMRLDTLPTLTAAMQLYESAGFVRCAPYYDTPLPQTIFMELVL